MQTLFNNLFNSSTTRRDEFIEIIFISFIDENIRCTSLSTKSGFLSFLRRQESRTSFWTRDSGLNIIIGSLFWFGN